MEWVSKMRSGKMVLVTALLLALGVFVLPSTVSLFEGQHIWYSKQNVTLKCDKCHADIAAELFTSKIHSNLKCIDCHQVNKIPQGAHAAGTVACTDCHSNVISELLNDTHRPYFEAALNDDLMTGANEACVGCHTHAGVNITFIHKQNLTFTAEALGSGKWIVGNMSAE